MSQTPPTAYELNCPNCGAPYTLPGFGNQVTCAHCGSHFVVPASVRAAGDTSAQGLTEVISLNASPTLDQTQVRRWVRWLVIFIVVTTIVPVVCGVGAAICGVLAPLVTLLIGR